MFPSLDERLHEDGDVFRRERLRLDDFQLRDLRQNAERGIVVRVLDDREEVPRFCAAST